MDKTYGNKYAETKELKKPDGSIRLFRDCLRVYKAMPGLLAVQIRTYGPTNETRNGKHRDMISTINITKEQAVGVIEQLQDFIK